MADAYRNAKGALIDKLLASLDAAEAEGGDIRGRQSAAILIVDGRNTGRPWNDTIFDLRVDDAVEPVIEIRRLADVRKAYLHKRRADAALAQGDLALLDSEYEIAERLIGDNPEMRYWHSIALLSLGQIESGLAMLKEIGARDRNWIELALRLPDIMLPRDPAVLQRIKDLLA